MATQPQGHPILPADHVTTAQTLPLNFRDTTVPARAPHVSTTGNVVTSDPLSTSPTANHYLSVPSHPVTEPTSSCSESPPKRRKLDISTTPDFPNVEAATTSRHLDNEPHPQQIVKHNAPETGSTKNTAAHDKPSPERSEPKSLDTPPTAMPTESLPSDINPSHQHDTTKQQSLPFSEERNKQTSSVRKRSSSPSSEATDNDTASKESHTEEPQTKKQKPSKNQEPLMSSASSIGSATMTRMEVQVRNESKAEADTVMEDVSTAKSTQNAKSVSVSPTPPTGAVLPLLRSSPVLVEPRDRVETRAPESKPDFPDIEMQNGESHEFKDSIVEATMDQDQQSLTGAQVKVSSAPKKKKTVSWAPEDKLVDVQYIDNRMELVKSWDTDSQVTLPFAPTTLQMFRQALKDQDAAKRNEGSSDGKGAESLTLRSMPKLTSFEEARKREHVMEQDRARQAREELKERLNAMTPSAPWKAPSEIVLPAECRIEEPSIERFDLAGPDCYPEKSVDPDARSPPSPPHESGEAYKASRRIQTNVLVIPLSDRYGQNGENEFESLPATSGMECRDYARPELRQDYFRENHDRIGPSEDSDGGFKAGPGSSKEYHYPDSRKSSVGSSGLDLKSDSRRKSQGQYGMVQNDYSDTNPAPAPSQAHAVQHLLSALQSSGLLKQGSGVLKPKNNSTDYSRTPNSDNPSSASDGSYREGQQGDQRNMRRSDDSSDTYENENRENDPPQQDALVQGQGMSTPDSNMPPPILGHSIGASFPPGMQQQGMMEMMHFPGAIGHPPMGMPPMGLPPPGTLPPGAIPPPPMAIPPPLGMLQMMGVPVPLMSMPPGMQMPDGSQGQSTSSSSGHSGGSGGRSGGGRAVETISRPKPKPMKQRKRCKYFGTKQGCRDGNSCMFAHN